MLRLSEFTTAEVPLLCRMHVHSSQGMGLPSRRFQNQHKPRVANCRKLNKPRNAAFIKWLTRGQKWMYWADLDVLGGEDPRSYTRTREDGEGSQLSESGSEV